MNVYDYKFRSIDGEEVSLADYKGKVLIIVNTASKCGFTPQYEDLQKLYTQYKEKGLEIIGFPSNQFEEQEPGSNSEVKNFCQLNYGVDFLLSEKTEVRGPNAHPLFQYLTEEKSFNGFNMNHPVGKILRSILEEKHPEFLVDNSVKWNFTKFVVNKTGEVVSRHEPTTSPLEMEEEIKQLLS